APVRRRWHRAKDRRGARAEAGAGVPRAAVDPVDGARRVAAPASDGDCGCRGRAVEAGDGRDTRPPATVGLASPAAEADDLIGPRTAVDACEHAVRTDGGGHQRAPQTLRRRMRRPASREFAGLWVALA